MIDHFLIDAVSNFQLKMDLPIVKLVQRKVANPLVFNGSGSLIQEDGAFTLKVIHLSPIYSDRKLSDIDDSGLVPGQIISEKSYFDMQCTDLRGNTWKAEKLYLDISSYDQSKSILITCKFSSLKNSAIHAERKKWIKFIIPESFRLPCTELEEYGRNSLRRSIFKFEFDHAKVKINNADGKLEIDVEVSESVNVSTFGAALLYALSILLGKHLIPAVKILCDKSEYINELNSVNLEKSKIMPRPIQSDLPFDLKSTVKFIERFTVQYVDSPDELKDLVGFWHKVFSSYSTKIEIIALTLSTSIEGVFKKYFEGLLHCDDLYIQSLDETVRTLQSMSIDSSIKQKLMSAAGGYKKMSVKKGLEKLINGREAYVETPNDWSILRNQSAHADTLDESSEEIQKYLNRAFSCLGLFYLLVFEVIGYKDERILYSVKSHPNSGKMGIIL